MLVSSLFLGRVICTHSVADKSGNGSDRLLRSCIASVILTGCHIVPAALEVDGAQSSRAIYFALQLQLQLLDHHISHTMLLCQYVTVGQTYGGWCLCCARTSMPVSSGGR
ncbi:hypothetical protein EDC01DRAFT_638167 [Geopyxis carbonaria]|nr:hypothetical protein EDC01DRAFT_638167 [Geopyxis carbonaria]